MRKPFFLGLLSLILCLSATAQVPHGGEPLWQDQPVLIDVPVHRMPGIDLEALRIADEVTDAVKSAPWRFGEEFDVNIGLDDGHWSTANGTAVWRTVIEAPEALAISLRFSAFQLPKGAQLFIWNRDGIEFIGSFNHRNQKRKLHKLLATKKRSISLVTMWIPRNCLLYHANVNAKKKTTKMGISPHHKTFHSHHRHA